MANRGRAKSCTACRQVKLACDARKNRPGPCTRCNNRNIQCRFDSNFKRISTRKIVQEITNGARMSPLSGFGPVHAPNTLDFTQSRLLANIPTPPGDVPVTTEAWLQIVDNDVPGSHVLGSFSLNNRIAVELFGHFEQYYKPHASFLQPITTPLATFAKTSPLLFWTIILCSSQMHSKYGGLYAAISAEHEILLSNIMHTAIQSIHVLHALLCLCLWPIPKLRQQFDPSWNYIGHAINAAMHLNCHIRCNLESPLSDWRGFGGFTMKDIGAHTRNLTWLACFDIGTRVGEFLGFPSPLSSPYHLKSITKAQDESAARISPSFRAILEIRRITSVSTMQLEAVDDVASHFSLTQTFIANLDALTQIYRQFWTPEVNINFQGAKLYLYAMTFTLTRPQDPAKDCLRLTYQQIILRHGLQSAATLVSSMTKLSLDSPPDELPEAVNKLVFYPKLYFTNLFFASVFLFRVLLSYHTATREDTSLAVSSLTEAHKIFQSVHRHRDGVRAAITIETLVAITRDGSKTDSLPMSELIITSRLGASLMYDALFRSAQHANRHPVSGKSSPVVTWKPLNARERHRLPSAPEERVNVAKPSASNVLEDEQSVEWWQFWDTYLGDFGIGVENWNVEMWNAGDDLFGYEMIPAAAGPQGFAQSQ
ncbi:transcriptional regulatory protein SEF1 [Lipomyces doorenjongii]